MPDFLKNIFSLSPQNSESTDTSWYTTKIVLSSILILWLVFVSIFFNTAVVMILGLSALLQIFIGLPLYVSLITRFGECRSKIIPAVLGLGCFGLVLYLYWAQKNWLELTSFTSLTLMAALSPYGVLIADYYAQKLLGDSQHFVQNLAALKPKTALKKVGSQFVEVSRNDIKIDDILKVPGSTLIPCDGKIISGSTSVDEAAITGEFHPLFKGVGDFVTGATLNRDSELTIKATKPIAENTLEKLILLATTRLGKNLRLYKRLSAATLSLSFVGILVAVATGLCLFLFFAVEWVPALTRGMTVLASFAVFTYPHAFLILINHVFEHLFKKGIVIHNTDVLEKLARIKTLFIDKTGTLTRGNFDYSQMFIEMGTNQGQFLTSTFSLEMQSTHPLAKSMDKHPWYNEITKLPVKGFEVHPGLGICGTIMPRAHREYFAAVGNLRFLKRLQMMISRDMKAKADELEVMGETVLLCGYDRQVRGLVSFADSLRPKVRETLKRLQKLGIEPAIITGDSEEGVAHLSTHLDIKKVFSRCTPEEKSAKIAREVNDGLIVGFLGSRGDSLAAGKAHATITLATGSDFSDITSDVILMGENFGLVSDVFKSLKKGLVKMQLLIALGIATTTLTTIGAALGVVNGIAGLSVALGMNLFMLWRVRQTSLVTDSQPTQASPEQLVNA